MGLRRPGWPHAATLAALLVLWGGSSAAQTMTVTNGLTPTTVVVPLGVDPPPSISAAIAAAPACEATPTSLCKDNISLAAFRVQVTLPAGMVRKLIAAGHPLNLAIESESVPGADTPETVAPLPRAHLRSVQRDGSPEPRSVTIPLQSLIPASVYDSIKYQSGANLFVSPWIIAIADPRAAAEYNWGTATTAQKRAAGCDSCDRPASLRGKGEADGVYELFTSGRFITVRLDGPSEANPLAGTAYAYLGEHGRLSTRVVTTMADSVRPDVAIAQTNPTNGTMIEQRVYVHSGEVAESHTDLGFKGRGLDFALTRFYSSASVSFGSFGRNFDSPLFARVRALPNGNVQYFDGTGRIDTFVPLPGGGYASPPGVFSMLTRSADGLFVLNGPNNFREFFDLYGRLVRMTDRNMTRSDFSDGNSMLFLYGPTGNLATVLDPVGRQVNLSYNDQGLVDQVTDYAGRSVLYTYDASGRMLSESGPDAGSTTGSGSPKVSYHWMDGGVGSYRAQLYSSGAMTAQVDGEARTVVSIGYRSDEPWSASTVESGGGTWSFAYSGSQTSVTDPNGYTYGYLYDSAGRVTTVEEPGGARSTYAFDGENRLLSSTEPMGESILYEYAAPASAADKRPVGNVTMVTQLPRPGTPEAIAGISRIRKIAYGVANLPVQVIEADGSKTVTARDVRGNPSSITDASGIVTTYTFDERGQLTQTSDPRTGVVAHTYENTDPLRLGYMKSMANSDGITSFTTDTRGNVVHVSDASGDTEDFVFNQIDEMEKQSQAESVATVTYDATGAAKTQSVLAGSDTSGAPSFNTVEMDTDEVGRLREERNNGEVTDYTYDAAGNQLTVVRSSSPTVSYSYDDRNRIASMSLGPRSTTYTYDDDGISTGVTDARGKSTSFLTDGFGQSTGTVDATGVTTQSVLDALGRVVDSRTVKRMPDGKTYLLRWTQRQYDSLGRMITEIRKLFASPLLIPTDGSDPAGATDIVTRTVYDDAGHKVTSIDPRGFATISEFDSLGRPLRMTDPLGNTETTHYAADGTKDREISEEVAPDGSKVTSTIVYYYDSQKRVTSVSDITDPTHPLTEKYEYDARGNQTKVTDADGNSTTSSFDLKGRRISETAADGGTTRYKYDDADRLIEVDDANGNPTRYGYDTNGDLVSEQRADGATFSSTYDADGNKLTVTDANGTVTTYAYDDLNRLVGKTIAKASGIVGPSLVSWTLDDLGRAVASVTEDGVAETFSYDSLDRQLSESVQISSGPKRTVTKSYDDGSNLTGLILPSGLALQQNIDPLGRTARMSEVGTASPIVSYSDIGRRLASKVTANGLSELWTYDPNRRLREIADQLPQSTVRDVVYDRTAYGDKLSIARPDLGTKSTYRYNPNHSITNETLGVPLASQGATAGSSSTDYILDKVLNYTSILQNNGTISPAINSRNQYTTFGADTLAYDRNGNLTTYAGRSLKYDAMNQLRMATVPGGATLESLYDAQGRKVRESTSVDGLVTTRDYVLSGPQVAEEYVNGALAARYVHGRDIDEIVRAEQSTDIPGRLDRVIYPVQDELENVERLTDGSGGLIERYQYEGYGQFSIFDTTGATSSSSAVGWRWLFQGRESDDVTGSYDFRARTLWPELTRFGQEDPAGGGGRHHYQSFLGDWTSNTDPSGDVVVLMHGISDDGMNGGWAEELSEGLTDSWLASGADPGQDVALLNNHTASDQQFGKSNAWLSAQGELDDDTMYAGKRTASIFQRVRALLDSTPSRRKGEPLQAIVHSHGTAMILAAARQNHSFHLHQVLLVGSDLYPFIDLAALATSVDVIHSFYSAGDDVTGLPTVGAAGHRGFRVATGFNPDGSPQDSLRPDTAVFMQHALPGVGHSASYLERAHGKISWVSGKLARTYYGPLTAIRRPRLEIEPASWFELYDDLRNTMGRRWTIPIPSDFLEPYSPR